MKAAVCHEFGKPLVVEEIELDPPQAGEIRVKLAACAICHSDIHYMEGAWGGTLPVVFGHEAAGIVADVGAGVSRFRLGDRVVVSLVRSCGRCFYCVQGLPTMCETEFALDKESRLHAKDGRPIYQGLQTAAFAEYVVVEESQIVRIPIEMPLDRASLLACGVITGYGAVVNTARIYPGCKVVVIGTGGVGLNSVQAAHLTGAQIIIAVDLVNSKLKAARAFGATHTVNPIETDVVEVVGSLTQGRGADYVFVTVGSGQAIEQGLALMRPAGTLVIVGMPAYGVQVEIEAVNVAGYSHRILGSKMGSARLAVDVPVLVELYRQGRLKLDELISARYPLVEINEAIDAVKQGEAVRNVIVF